MKTKVCNTCLKELPVSAFYQVKNRYSTKTGPKVCHTYTPVCKECAYVYHRRMAYRDMPNKLKRLLTSAKSTAKSRRLEVSISNEFVTALFHKQNGRCFYSGIELQHTVGGHAASLDRVDPRLGYTEENTVLTCGTVNYMKGPLSAKTFFETCVAIARHYEQNPPTHELLSPEGLDPVQSNLQGKLPGGWGRKLLRPKA